MSLEKVVSIVLFVVIAGCAGQPNKKNGLNLMGYGIPFTILVPEDVQVTKLGAGSLTDVNIHNNDGYDIQVFMGNAFTSANTKLKQQKKDQVIELSDFSKIVEEFDSGFIFEKKHVGEARSYDFFVIMTLSDKEISFQGGNSKNFTETEVKKMVKSILDGY